MALAIVIPWFVIIWFVFDGIIGETDEEKSSRQPDIEDFEYYLRGE